MKNKLFNWDCSGMALVTVLILVIILTLIAAALLSLQANQVKLITHDDRRTRARYAEEAAMVRQLENLRKGGASEPSHDVDGFNVNIGFQVINSTTDMLNFSHDYSVNF